MEALLRNVQALLESHGWITASIAAVILVAIARISWPRNGGSSKPLFLPDAIPFVYNTYQYFANQRKFLSRCA